jgi:hypothetical protein
VYPHYFPRTPASRLASPHAHAPLLALVPDEAIATDRVCVRGSGGLLATAVLLGLVLNATLSWWWADPAAGYVLVCDAACVEQRFATADSVGLLALSRWSRAGKIAT